MNSFEEQNTINYMSTKSKTYNFKKYTSFHFFGPIRTENVNENDIEKKQ